MAHDLRRPVDVHHSGGLCGCSAALMDFIDDRGTGRVPDEMPQVMCAVCNKPVNHTFWSTDCRTDYWEVRVCCHGDEDTCKVPNSALEEQLEPGWAFVVKRRLIAPSAITGIDSALIGPDQPDE